MTNLILGIYQELPQASNFASDIDWLFNFILWLNIIGFVAVVIPMAYFAIKYRRSQSDPNKTPMIEGHTPSEMGVSLGLLVLVMLLFWWGWKGYDEMTTMPKDGVQINVYGHQWYWEFVYADGTKVRDELVIPKGENIKLTLTSTEADNQAVLHSLYIPNFRVKQDAVPGIYTKMWFKTDALGEHVIYCAEFCGTLHSKMLGKVRVVEPEEFTKWLTAQNAEAHESADNKNVNPLDLGKKVYTQSCAACHSIDESKIVGPGFAKLFGKEEEIEGGSKVKVDENYLRESIVDPNAKVVKGYPPVMSTFKGVLKDDEIEGLITYIKSLQ